MSCDRPRGQGSPGEPGRSRVRRVPAPPASPGRRGPALPTGRPSRARPGPLRILLLERPVGGQHPLFVTPLGHAVAVGRADQAGGPSQLDQVCGREPPVCSGGWWANIAPVATGRTCPLLPLTRGRCRLERTRRQESTASGTRSLPHPRPSPEGACPLTPFRTGGSTGTAVLGTGPAGAGRCLLPPARRRCVCPEGTAIVPEDSIANSYPAMEPTVRPQVLGCPSSHDVAQTCCGLSGVQSVGGGIMVRPP